MDYTIKNLALCEMIWTKTSSKITFAESIVSNIKSSSSFSDTQLEIIRKKLCDSFIPVYTKKWAAVCRKKKTFINNVKNKFFLEVDFKLL